MITTIVILGKNKIAVRVATRICTLYPNIRLLGVANADDCGEDGWQPSFRLFCRRHGIEIKEIIDIEGIDDALVLSLECDKLLKPSRFASRRLFNIHFSALPKYRGVLTSIWPILNGESESGVTLHRVDPGIDTGDIVAQTRFAIELNDTAEILYEKYLDYGTALLEQNLESLITNSENAVPQSRVGATYYSRKSVDFSNITIQFFCTSYQVHNNVRAFCFPAYQFPIVEGHKIKSSLILETAPTGKPGLIVDQQQDHFDINTLDGQVRLFFAQ